MRKLFTFLIALVAGVGTISAESGTCGENLTWDLTDGVLTISGIGEMTNYSNLDEVPWAALRSTITSVVIADGISTIGDFSLRNLQNVTSVSMPNSIIRIGNYSFSYCYQLAHLSLPNKLQTIGNGSFEDCSSLIDIVLPNSVYSIGALAFSNCSSLKQIVFSENLWQIGFSILKKCSNLEAIVWNAKKCYRDFTFASTPFFEDSEYSTSYYDIRSNITTIMIGENVEYIPAYLFYGCTNASVTIKNPFILCGDGALAGSLTCDDSAKNDSTISICEQQEKTSFTVKEDGELITKIFDQTGDYSFISICGNECSLHVINNSSFTQLPDTTICPGEWIFDGDPQVEYGYWYVDEGSPYTFDRPCPECDIICSNCEGEGVDWSDVHSYLHYVEYADACPEGTFCYERYINGQQFYDAGTFEFSHRFTNSKGCDSIVTRNVIVRKVAAPKIIVTPEQDICNSGTIRMYNKYCTGSEYHEGQYKYYYDNAEYDYFTINGTKYEFSSAMEGEYNQYYHPDGIRVIDEPSMVIDNLSAGNYHIVFYSACDSVVEEVTIEGYAIEIDGVYYKYHEGGPYYFEGIYEDHPQGLEITYRGASAQEYDEYSGNIVIPDSVFFNGKKLPICYVNREAFDYAPDLKALTFKSATPPIYEVSNGWTGQTYYYTKVGLDVQVNKLDIYVPFGTVADYQAIITQCFSHSAYGTSYGSFTPDFHVINPDHVNIDPRATSAIISFGNEEERKHIKACGLVDGEEFGGSTAEYIGLEPNRTYSDVPFFVKTIEGDSDVIVCSFTTTEIELTTLASKPVASDAAILLAQTNIADVETSCGFEWKRNDAPEDMAPNKVYSPVANGTMAGRLKNLNDQVYYKYRAFYESAVGNMYYGDWQYIFTGDNAVEYDPVLYTYAATAVKEHEATLKGYALEGSDDFTEQGFEYWADSRVKHNKPGIRFKSQLGEKQTVVATGILMQVTLTDLDQGTTYKYRTFAKFGDQVAYGPEMSFTTQGEWIAFTVTFLDKDGNVIAIQEVEPGDNAVAPDAPKVDGYKFIGWDKDLTNVQSNMTVTAQYAVAYTVRFVDWDGELLKNEQVAKGKDATPPEDPVRTGYNFIGWDKDYTNVQSDLTITAQYKIKTFTVRFLDWNDTELKVETVEYGKSATVPEAPTREGYTFKGWDTEFDNVKSNLDVKAVYEKNADEAIDEINSSNSQTIKLIKHGNLYILRNGEMYNAQGAKVK